MLLTSSNFDVHKSSIHGDYKYDQSKGIQSILTLRIPTKGSPRYNCNTMKSLDGTYSCHGDGTVAGEASHIMSPSVKVVMQCKLQQCHLIQLVYNDLNKCKITILIYTCI